jgi:hypothetical protein
MGEKCPLLNLNGYIEWKVLSGPFLVSRTGDAGCSERWVKVPKCTLIRYHKGC